MRPGTTECAQNRLCEILLISLDVLHTQMCNTPDIAAILLRNAATLANSPASNFATLSTGIGGLNPSTDAIGR